MGIKKSFRILIIILLFIEIQSIKSQTTIKTVTAFKQKSNTNFSPEWQYLSSDLYLLNAQKFSDLLNDIERINSGGKKRRKLTDENLQSLFIKAKIKNIRFFGGDVVYPVYNFKISESKDYTTVETGNVEVVRLIENLPLNESNEVIDAEISGEAITQKNSNDFLRLIATQMQGMSKFSKPNVAILDLIGELGRYIESKTTGKQYKFSSTIRLYEGQEFDKKLHSVNIFVFAPSSVSKVYFPIEQLSAYIDSSDHAEINQEVLSKLITYKKYPFIVVANYKSRYNSQLVTGDQINFDYLTERKLKIQNAYQNELINKTTYNQELKLIEFLNIFADLKLHINNYKLNLENHITNDYSKNHFIILKIYRDLLKVKNLRMIEFHGNTEFENEFLPKYESVITTAGLYLNEKNSLTNVKQVAELIENQKIKHQQVWNSEVAESDLALLYSVKIPDDETDSEQTKELKSLIYNTENSLFAKVYSTLIVNISQLSTDEGGLQEKEKIENQSGNTWCKKCKTELSLAIKNYTTRYLANEKNKLLNENDTIKQQVMSTLFKALEKKKCIEGAMEQNTENQDNTLKDLVTIQLNKLNETIDETRNLFKQDIKNMGIRQLKEQNQQLEENRIKLEAGFENLCKNLNTPCDCDAK